MWALSDVSLPVPSAQVLEVMVSYHCQIVGRSSRENKHLWCTLSYVRQTSNYNIGERFKTTIFEVLESHSSRLMRGLFNFFVLFTNMAWTNRRWTLDNIDIDVCSNQTFLTNSITGFPLFRLLQGWKMYRYIGQMYRYFRFFGKFVSVHRYSLLQLNVSMYRIDTSPTTIAHIYQTTNFSHCTNWKLIKTKLKTNKTRRSILSTHSIFIFHFPYRSDRELENQWTFLLDENMFVIIMYKLGWWNLEEA